MVTDQPDPTHRTPDAPDPAPAPPLVARGVAFAYDEGVPVLNGVDLALEAGEVLAVIGPNGSGKSTLVRLLAGILAPDGGDVELDGRPIGQRSPRERARRIAFVPQEVRLPGDASVEGFVEGGRYAHLGFWRRTTPRDREAVRGAIACAELEELRERRLAEMSTGQRQRVLLARAMAQEAEILLVDEPTTSLDAHHQMRTFETLVGMVRGGRSALVVTHELNLASRFADRVALLSGGRVRACGSPEAVIVPEVIEPVYGPDFHFGSLPAGPRGEPRPFVVPWKRSRPE